jgi:hypothetical protein
VGLVLVQHTIPSDARIRDLGTMAHSPSVTLTFRMRFQLILCPKRELDTGPIGFLKSALEWAVIILAEVSDHYVL